MQSRRCGHGQGACHVNVYVMHAALMCARAPRARARVLVHAMLMCACARVRRVPRVFHAGVGEHARSDFRHALLLRVCLSCVHFVRRTLAVLSRMLVRAIVCVYVRVRARVRFPGAHAATFLRRALVRVRLPGPRMRAHHFAACILGRTKKLVDGLVVRHT